MNNIAENIAPDAAQSVKPPAVGETNAAAEKSHRAQNTGSSASRHKEAEPYAEDHRNQKTDGARSDSPH